VSQMTASGRIAHKHMDAETLITRLRNHFPKLERSAGDFVIPLGDCRAEFFCINSQHLDFRISPVASDGANRATTSKAITAIEMLVQSTDVLWEGLRSSLRHPRSRKFPTLIRCVIQDTQSRVPLLIHDSSSPLRSPGAKTAYAMSLIFCITGAFLVVWQLHTSEPSGARTANILAIALPIGVAVISTPAPILINWREWKKTFTWRYVRIG